MEICLKSPHRTVYCILTFVLHICQGKLHQNSLKWQQAKICASKALFLKRVNNPNFVDFYFISSEGCVTLHDGVSINTKNIPSISGFCYSQSKRKSPQSCIVYLVNRVDRDRVVAVCYFNFDLFFSSFLIF